MTIESWLEGHASPYRCFDCVVAVSGAFFLVVSLPSLHWTIHPREANGTGVEYYFLANAWHSDTNSTRQQIMDSAEYWQQRNRDAALCLCGSGQESHMPHLKGTGP